MMSVFTNYLRPYYEKGLLPEVDQSDVSNIYDQLRIAYNQGSIGVLNTTRMIAPFANDEDDYDIIDAVWNSKELQKWLQWVNTVITLEIGVQSYLTLGVRLRIAATWLTKIVNDDAIPIPIGARIHNNLCDNTWNEHRMIINAGLPF